MTDRLYRMIETHARIDAALIAEQRSRCADWRRLTELKKLKLRVKDLIHRMTTQRQTARG